LIPGLRVYTTQVAGVSRVPLRTFIAGLLPANAVYIAAFIGLGAAFGRPILALIQLAEHQLVIALLILVPLVGVFLLTRAPARRILASLEAGGWTGPLRFSLDSVGVVLILGCLGLNFAGHAIVVAFWLVLVAIASLVSTPLNFLLSGGKSNVALGDSIYAALDGAHLPRVLAAFVGEAAVDLPDKLLTVIAALLIAQGLPERRGVG